MKPASLVLRAGIDGALLVPDLAYPRAFTLRVGRTDQSYVDLDDPLRLEFDYVQRLDTRGGVAPAGACQAGASVAVPYTATYNFWGPTNP